MKVIAFCIMVAAWICVFVWRGNGARVVQILLFGFVGGMLTLLGAFSFWWDRSMRPDQASVFILVCGVLTLLPLAVGAFIGVLEAESGADFPKLRSKRSASSRARPD
jgi:hypothetical protein